ncbi:MAG TPA: hypothetical protein VNG33_04810, partial [Polyangiaceae bacterium]|nr:hypothetical protein [Polyangiaceae bacterium]
MVRLAERLERRRWSARFALASLCLHALLVGLGLLRQHRHGAEPAMAPSEPGFEIDVVPEEVTSAVTEEHAIGEPEPYATSRQAQRGKALRDAARENVVDDASVTTADATPGEAPGETAEAPQAAPSAAAPHLSLAALGVDGQNPFLERADPAAIRAAKIARAKRRLDNSFAQGLLNQDVASGRGAGGPVVRSLETAVYASTVPLNGSALFTLIIDGDGKLLSNTLGETSGDRESWARVARQTVRSLAPRKLTVPKGKSVRLTVEVTSHLELPSGRDPGLE